MHARNNSSCSFICNLHRPNRRYVCTNFLNTIQNFRPICASQSRTSLTIPLCKLSMHYQQDVESCLFTFYDFVISHNDSSQIMVVYIKRTQNTQAIRRCHAASNHT